MNKLQITKKIVSIDGVLESMYGPKKRTKFTAPVDELILTILSQNTNDINRDKAYNSLRAIFPAWSDVAEAKKTEIAKAIKVGGLANIKSGRIKSILGQIGKLSPDYSLSFLKDMGDKAIMEFLLKFDGVGPKTASCVLLFSLGRKAMPVDTHVYRIGQRLGIIPDDADVEKAHQWFHDLNPDVDILKLHLNLIQHGRILCRPRNPKCGNCQLRKYCLYFKQMAPKQSKS